MNIATLNYYLQYVALSFATLFFIPQLVVGYKLRSLKHVSSMSMIMIVTSSGLWGYCMFISDNIYYAIPSIFLCITAILGLVMQLRFYYERLNKHITSLDTI